MDLARRFAPRLALERGAVDKLGNGWWQRHGMRVPKHSD
jgi:hypothetical protein